MSTGVLYHGSDKDISEELIPIRGRTCTGIKGSFIFATDSLVRASCYSLNHQSLVAVGKLLNKNVAFFKGPSYKIDNPHFSGGFIYEVPRQNFQSIKHEGQDTGEWITTRKCKAVRSRKFQTMKDILDLGASFVFLGHLSYDIDIQIPFSSFQGEEDAVDFLQKESRKGNIEIYGSFPCPITASSVQKENAVLIPIL
jgi:hypothetical protein